MLNDTAGPNAARPRWAVENLKVSAERTPRRPSERTLRSRSEPTDRRKLLTVSVAALVLTVVVAGIVFWPWRDGRRPAALQGPFQPWGPASGVHEWAGANNIRVGQVFDFGQWIVRDDRFVKAVLHREFFASKTPAHVRFVGEVVVTSLDTFGVTTGWPPLDSEHHLFSRKPFYGYGTSNPFYGTTALGFVASRKGIYRFNTVTITGVDYRHYGHPHPFRERFPTDFIACVGYKLNYCNNVTGRIMSADIEVFGTSP